MDAVAERAEIGVATLYTYFGNKENLFAELARKDMTELKDEAERALEDLPADPVLAVIELLTIYDKVRNYISKDVIRDFSIGTKLDGPLRDAARWMDEWKVHQIVVALDRAQEEGRIASTLPTRDAAEIVNELFNHYYDRQHTSESDRKAFNKLKSRIALLFQNWVN